MTDITIDGEIFRVEVEGDPGKPTLLLSSSLGADLSMWDAQMPAFLTEFRVVRYDPRGHGRSTRAGAPYSLARLGADVVAILDALGIERTHFLGISMGGAVGQWLLVNAPERIDRAVLANTNARFGPPHLWNDRIRTVLSQGPQALAAATMQRWFSQGFRDAEADKVAAMDKVFRATSGEGYAAAAAALRDMDMREALRTVDRPVLLVTGRDDGIASAADIATMRAAIAGVRHVELECQHISNIEARASFDAAVVGFLTGPLPASAGKSRAAKPKAARKPVARRAAGRATSARSPLKRTPAVATPSRRPRTADPSRTATKAVRAKAGPRKAARPATTRRVSPVVGRAPVAKANAKPAKVPARKKPAAKAAVTTLAKPRRTAAASTATRKAVAKKAVTKKAVTKKTATKKVAAKKTPVKKGKTTGKAKPAPKLAARRTTKKRPGRPTSGRGRR